MNVYERPWSFFRVSRCFVFCAYGDVTKYWKVLIFLGARAYYLLAFRPQRACTFKHFLLESLAENGVIFGRTIFPTWPPRASPRFVDVSEEKSNCEEENAIPRNTKHATKLGIALFKGNVWKFAKCIKETIKIQKFPWKCRYAWVNQNNYLIVATLFI